MWIAGVVLSSHFSSYHTTFRHRAGKTAVSACSLRASVILALEGGLFRDAVNDALDLTTERNIQMVGRGRENILTEK